MSDVKVYARNLEETAREQIETLMFLDVFSEARIRIMPDAHAGAGCVIGFTADLGDKVVPNLVGVDIGCGMYTVELADDSFPFERLDDVINKCVPHGFGVNGKDVCDVSKLGLRCFDRLKNVGHLNKSLGTLGGGNHFIAVDEDECGHRYLVIHTGSRNLGLQVAVLYQKIASETCDADVPKDLKWLEGQCADDYLHDMYVCQEWAVKNREEIARKILVGLRVGEMTGFHTTHNYIAKDDGIIRKGAISAKRGERVLIPLNMRDGCLLCTGLGNADWNNSAPHGAGRTMSRRKAKETLSLEEFKEQMSGIYSTTVCQATIDEAPDAYKNATDIIEAIDGVTVDIDARLREVYNFKSTQVGRRVSWEVRSGDNDHDSM